MQCEREPQNAADQYRYKIHVRISPSVLATLLCTALLVDGLSQLLCSLRVTACDGRVCESEPLGSGRPSFESVSDRRTRHARYLVPYEIIRCRKNFVEKFLCFYFSDFWRHLKIF